jgi:RHS repeat-associated protein
VDDTENQSGSLEDFMYRRYNPTQGRWISPDPAGLGVVDPSNPQTWNRYAYVLNNPAVLIDPLGLYWLEACVQVNGGAPECSWSWEDDGGGGGPAQNPGGGTFGGGGGRGTGAANNCVKPNFAQRAAIKVLTEVANWSNKTVGYGFGASYGLGFGQGFGFAGTASAQLQVSPGGGASLVYTYGERSNPKLANSFKFRGGLHSGTAD